MFGWFALLFCSVFFFTMGYGIGKDKTELKYKLKGKKRN